MSRCVHSALVLAVLVVATAAVTAHPPEQADHGIQRDIFVKLWSGDQDGSVQDGSGSAIGDIANGTDYSFGTPPKQVEIWNRRDLDDFEPGDVSTSVHPPDTDLEDGRFLKDAYTAIFALQPSTRVHVSPNRTLVYVAPGGEVLATVDYRIRVPADDTSGDRRVYWSIDSHEIRTVRLTAGDTTLGSTDGSHTPELGFSDLDPGNQTLTVESTVNVTMQKTIRKRHFRDDDPECRKHEDNDNDLEDDDDDWQVDEGGECYYWTTHYQYPSEQATVNESIPVRVYQIDPTVRYARFPDGSVEVLVEAGTPWRGFTIQDASITGRWRFFTARSTRWDNLTEASAGSERSIHSPIHPLQVHAYPSKAGVFAEPAVDGPTIVATWGTRHRPPGLPDAINVEVVNRSYNTTTGIVVRLADADTVPDQVTIHGLVRGERYTPRISGEQVRRSNLTVAVVNATRRNVTVAVTLRDNATGQPIDLTDRAGVVELSGGHHVTTDADGRVNATIPKPISAVIATYHPGPWWRTDPSYVGDTDQVFLPAEFPSVARLLSVLTRLAVIVAPILTAGYLLHRTIGGAAPAKRRLP